MDWSHLQRRIPYEKNFRWRGGEVSRIEAFTDAVFALSMTLLLVSTEVPTSYGELIATMKAFPAFAISFVLLLMVWYFHFIHFRRYGLEDVTTLFLNFALLFVVLFYVYPLKLMFAYLHEWAVNGLLAALNAFELTPETIGHLLAIYGAGFALMYLILTLMAGHALRMRRELELNEVEVVMTRALINTHLIQVAAGLLSTALALLLPTPYQGMAGFAYMVLPVAHPLHGNFVTRQENAALARMVAGEAGKQAAVAVGATSDEQSSAAVSVDDAAAPKESAG